MASFFGRMMGAALLNVRTYDEVKANANATPGAMTVVLLSSVASGIVDLTHGGIIRIVFSLLGWFVWFFLIYVTGTKTLPEAQTQSDPLGLLRTTGFACAPGVLSPLSFIPIFGTFLKYPLFVWVLATMARLLQLLRD